MQISLNKQSRVPLHEQLSEQLVFLITTKKLPAGEQLPSVRSFAKRLGIHHNTVSRSYQDLVNRGWLRRQRGSRLYVDSAASSPSQPAGLDLDGLINQTIRRAGELGYSLQALRSHVLERLLAQPPDHILVVEDEQELNRIICAEISSHIQKGVAGCALDQLTRTPELAFGSQVVASERQVRPVNSLLSQELPCIQLAFASADGNLDLVKSLKESSVIGVASISKTFLKTARSLLAPLVGRRHVIKLSLVVGNRRVALDGIDIAFCDAVTISLVRCQRKIQYRLIAERCLEDIAVSLKPPMASKN